MSYTGCQIRATFSLFRVAGYGHVRLQCRIRREPISIATNTYRTRNDAVTETKKSQATISLAWFRTKVDHRWLVPLPRRGFISRYRRTVRGETRMPSLTSNSLAIRSSPQVGLSRSIPRISSLRFLGNGGRPRRRDFHRHNIRKAVRCHLRNVSGLTITSAHRQSKNRASATIAKRVAGVVLRLFVLRSWNRASCFRRKRFSAMRAAREDQNKRIKVNNFRFYNPLLVLRPDAGELGSYFLRTTRASRDRTAPASWDVAVVINDCWQRGDASIAGIFPTCIMVVEVVSSSVLDIGNCRFKPAIRQPEPEDPFASTF